MKDLEAYLKKNLPRNDDGLILKPTVNNWHVLSTVNVEPPLLNLPEPVETFELKKSKELNFNESSSRLTIEASNQWKEPQFEEKDQPDLESEDRQLLTINELSQKLKAQDQVIQEMAKDMMNLKEENQSLKMKYDDIKSNEASILSRIISLELNNMNLSTNYFHKRPPEVNSLFRSEMKKPEVNSSRDLGQRIDRLVKKATMSFGGFNLKRNSNK